MEQFMQLSSSLNHCNAVLKLETQSIYVIHYQIKNADIKEHYVDI